MKRAVLLVLAACAGAAPRVAPVPGAAHEHEHASPALAASLRDAELGAYEIVTVPPADLDVTLAARVEPSPAVLVTVTSRLEAIELEMASSPAKLEIRDAAGPLPADVQAGHVRLSRAPKLPVTFRYEIAADGADPHVSEATSLRATAEHVLLLPVTDARVRVRLTFDVAKAAMEHAASTFGSGLVEEAAMTVRELSHAAFVAGQVYDAHFDAYEGQDNFAWIGETAFDPRWMAADVASTRSALGIYFGDRQPVAFRMIASGERTAGPFTVLPRTKAILLVVDPATPWHGALRLTTTLPLVARWIGGVLPADAESVAWFEGGVGRFVAREVLFASGGLAPSEYVAEVNRSIATVALGPDPVARGDLMATEADARLRRQKRSLREVLRKLVSQGGTMTRARWEQVLGDALPGPDAPLSADALGSCFTTATLTFEEFALGMEKNPKEHVLEAVDPKGPAYRAGLRNGEKLLSLAFQDGRADVPVVATVERKGKPVDVRFAPVGKTARGTGMKRVPGVEEALCARP